MEQEQSIKALELLLGLSQVEDRKGVPRMSKGGSEKLEPRQLAQVTRQKPSSAPK